MISVFQILVRMNKLCVTQSSQGTLSPRRNEQRLLRNMGIHAVVLELLQVGAEAAILNSMLLILLT